MCDDSDNLRSEPVLSWVQDDGVVSKINLSDDDCEELKRLGVGQTLAVVKNLRHIQAKAAEKLDKQYQASIAAMEVLSKNLPAYRKTKPIAVKVVARPRLKTSVKTSP